MSFNPNHDGNYGFQSLLYVNFIIRKKYRVDAIAREMQIATDTLYRYIRGENVIPADRIVDLVKATGDMEYLEFFCEPCGYLPVQAVKGKLCSEDRRKDQINLSILNGEALRHIETSFVDGKLDKAEMKKIEKALTRLQAKAAELKEKLRGEVA